MEKIKFVGAFEYLLEIIKNSDIINDYRLDGGRWSGKTTQAIIALCLVVSTTKKVNLIAMRYREDAILSGSGIEQSYRKILDNLKINYVWIAGKKRFELENGNRIDMRGAISKDGQPKFSGFAQSNNPDYILVHVDEAYEFGKNEWNGVREGIRGETKTRTIFVRTSNNWKANNWYVKELNKLSPYDLAKLQEDGEQKRVVGKTVIHHSNVTINPLVSPDLIEKGIDDAITDPERAKVSLWGMPGTLNGAMYNDFTKDYHTEAEEKELESIIEFSIGCCISNDLKEIGMVLIGRTNDKFIVLNEFSYSPEDDYIYKTSKQYVKEFNEKILEWIKLYKINNSLTILTSTTEKKWKKIQTIRYALTNNIDINNLTFDAEYNEELGIDILISVLIKEYLKIHKRDDLKKLLNQLDCASYDDKKKKRDKDGNDILIHALENALYRYRNFIKNLNTY